MADEETSAKQAGEVVGMARRYAVQAAAAAERAEKLLKKIPEDKQSQWLPAAREARAAANEAQQILLQIEGKAATKYLQLAANAASRAVNMGNAAIQEATKAVQPGASVEQAKEALKNAQANLEMAREGAETAKTVVNTMQGKLPFAYRLGVSPRHKAESAAAAQHRDTAIAKVKEAEKAVQYAKEKIVDLEAFAAPEAPTEARIISIKEVEDDKDEVKKAAKDVKSAEKEAKKEVNRIEKIITEINNADRDLVGVVQRTVKAPTKGEIADFYAKTSAIFQVIQEIFNSVRNRTKVLAEELNFKSRFGKIEQNALHLVQGFTSTGSLIEKLRPLATSTEAQAKLAEIDKAYSEVQAQIRILREATARLGQGHLQQYDNIRTECLNLLATIQKREKVVERYVGIVGIAIKNLGKLIPRKGAPPVDAALLAKSRGDVADVAKRLHQELTEVYEPTLKRIKDHKIISAEIIKTLRGDIEECERALTDIAKPAKTLQQGLLELQKLIKQIIPPPTAGVEYRR